MHGTPFGFSAKTKLDRSRGVRVGVPRRAFVFRKIHGVETVVVFGLAFLAGAFVFLLRGGCDLEEAVVFGSTLLAGALAFFAKT